MAFLHFYFPIYFISPLKGLLFWWQSLSMGVAPGYFMLPRSGHLSLWRSIF
jgi:hypothetical protein